MSRHKTHHTMNDSQDRPRLDTELIAAGEKKPRGIPKYRDPANPFNVWSGKGKRPTWLKLYLEDGRTLDEFAINEEI